MQVHARAAFKKSSALRRFNNGEISRVPEAMKMWKKAGGKVVQGLINRRNAEVKLFLTPVVEKPEPAPEPKSWLTLLLNLIKGWRK